MVAASHWSWPLALYMLQSEGGNLLEVSLWLAARDHGGQKPGWVVGPGAGGAELCSLRETGCAFSTEMYSSACVRALAPGLAPALFCGRACSGRVHPESPQHSGELRAARQEARPSSAQGPSQGELHLWADVDRLTYIPGEGTVPGLVWRLLRVLPGSMEGVTRVLGA